MRWLLVLACLVSVAGARPLNDPLGGRGHKLVELDGYDTANYSACERAKTWSKVVACLRKSGKVTVLHELDGVKLINIRYDSSRDNSTVYLYVERDKLWRRGNLYASTNPSSELLSFKKIGDPPASAERPGYRLEMGTITPATHAFDLVTPTRVMLSRKFTTVCGLDAVDCRTVMTACDAFVGGKAYWSFRGSPVWEGRNLKVTGDVTNGGRLCTPAKSVLVELD